MWFLIAIVLTATDLLAQPIDQYTTEKACLDKKAAWEQDFTKAYPGDRDWAFVCVKPTLKTA